MASLKRIFGNWWVLSLAAALLAVLVLAVGLPLVVGFLRPWWVRLLLVLLVAAIWGVFAGLRALSRRRAADALAEEIAQPATPGDAEAEALSVRMREALAGLKKASGDKRDYLYSRPWYVIIGPPGAGKTTALLNSGLRFPFSETALKGVGGTRNLDFWFADEAVMVDTAGRYTTQDSDAPADARAWESFLGLLRKNRPLQPINGVLVAIGLDEVLRADRAELDRHAAAIRRRLDELQKTLEVAAPVYVLFTKTDLLPGFTEYFDDLDVEGRRAVLGATLPWPTTALNAETLAREYDGVANAVSARSAKRLQDEADGRRRALILSFPAQWSVLRPRVMRLLEGAFLAERAAKVPLRGFYFTSGVQQGAPLDRLLNEVAQVYDAAPTATKAGGGRAYFLNRLLNEVVFPEAGLVQSDPAARRRRTTQLVAGLAALATVSLLVLVLWLVSFSQNRGLQNRLLAGATNAQQTIRTTGIDLVEARESDPDLEQDLSILRQLRDLPGGYAERRRHGPPLLSTFGLYQHGHARAAEQAYLQALQRIMLPRVLLRLEHYLQAHQQQPLEAYEPLKVYLMLGGQGPLDKSAVKAWVQTDWASDAFPGEDRESVRKELAQHLDALLADPGFGQVWPGAVAPLDGALIASTRAAVQTLSLADRAYAVLKQKAAAANGPSWRADTVLASGDGKAFANADAVLGLTIPYFYTRQGYEHAYQLGLQTVQADLQKDLWVMGSDVNKTAIQTQMQGVRPGVAAHYAQDYVSAWEAVVKTPVPAAYFHDPVAFGAFTRDPSPLKLLLLEVRKNTLLGGGGGAEQKAAASLKSKLGKVGEYGTLMAAGGPGGVVDAGQQIATAFKPLNDFVGSGGKAPIDDFVAAVKSAGAANAAAGVASGGLGSASAQGQLATATGAIAAASAGAPPLLQGFVGGAAEGGKTAATSAAQGALGDDYVKTIQPVCSTTVENRYPFYGASENDASTADMLRVFGLNGQIDGFARDRLTPLLDTSGPVWRWKTDPLAAAFDPLSAASFQKAAEIRDLLASGAPIKVSVDSFGGSVTSAEVSVSGNTYKYENGALGERPVIWSVSGLPEAHVTLFSGTQTVKTYAFQGPWALFRLFDAAKKENAGPTTFKATFGEGAAFVTLRVGLPSTKNPFGRGGAWSFRCPAKL